MIVKNGFIIAISKSDSDYNVVLRKIETKPSAPYGHVFRLRADTLEWELVELSHAEPEPLTDEEALTRYANTLTGKDNPDLISAAETLIEQRIKEES